MTRNPISKLFERQKPLSKDVEAALSRLAQLARQQPDLAELAATNAALLRVAFRDVPPLVLTITADHARAKLGAGVPLLRGEPLPLDAAWLRQRYAALCAVLAQQARQSATVSAAADATRQAIQRGTLDIAALVVDVLSGDPQIVVERAARLELDSALVATLLRWTLLPLLEQVAQQLQPLRARWPWPHGYCPTCGAWPLLAEQRGIEQTRVLRCGLCATEWPLERMLCPFCGSRNPADMGYLYEEGQEAARRVVTCERCHCYFKSVATLAPLPTPLLPVTDLATLHLDLIALERAYAPPS